MHLDPGVLRYLEGDIAIAREAIGDPIDPLAVAVDESLERDDRTGADLGRELWVGEFQIDLPRRMDTVPRTLLAGRGKCPSKFPPHEADFHTKFVNVL